MLFSLFRLDILKKSYLYKLLATFFIVLVASFFSGPTEWIIALVLISSVGLLHGANDLQIISKLKGAQGISKKSALLSYLLVILGVLVVFSFNRALALSFFVLISAFHFGQQHLSKVISGTIMVRYVLYTLYGGSVFGLLFYTHPIESATAIAEISNVFFSKADFLLFSASTSASWFVVFVSTNYSKIRLLLVEVLLLIVLSTLFYQVNLALAFALYFAFWHAIPSLGDQFNLLFGATSFRSVITYIRQSAVFWLLSIIGLAAVFSLVYFENKTPLPLLVYFLAAITFPHVIVMSSVENALKRA
jgi:Brp/Blh family beta-carotene 15,15'-monooxygenase